MPAAFSAWRKNKIIWNIYRITLGKYQNLWPAKSQSTRSPRREVADEAFDLTCFFYKQRQKMKLQTTKDIEEDHHGPDRFRHHDRYALRMGRARCFWRFLETELMALSRAFRKHWRKRSFGLYKFATKKPRLSRQLHMPN